MLSRLAAFVIWAAVAASIVFWAMRLWATPIAAPAHGTVASTTSGFNGDLGRVFGVDAPPTIAAMAAAPQAQADARFRLIGVVAPRAAAASAEGLALIATEGRPPKAYRVGAAVDGDLVLLGVHSRGASLGPRGQPAQLALELPALPPPATGTLPGSALAVPMPRPPAAVPPRPLQQPQPPQALPVVPVPGSTDADDAETQPEPTNPSTYAPPPGAGRPPTVESRPPTVDRRPPT
jgi:general secretion pathway protein C